MKRATNRTLRDADIGELARELRRKLQPYWDGTPEMRQALQQQYGRLFVRLHLNQRILMVMDRPEIVEQMVAAQKDWDEMIGGKPLIVPLPEAFGKGKKLIIR